MLDLSQSCFLILVQCLYDTLPYSIALFPLHFDIPSVSSVAHLNHNLVVMHASVKYDSVLRSYHVHECRNANENDANISDLARKSSVKVPKKKSSTITPNTEAFSHLSHQSPRNQTGGLVSALVDAD